MANKLGFGLLTPTRSFLPQNHTFGCLTSTPSAAQPFPSSLLAWSQLFSLWFLLHLWGLPLFLQIFFKKTLSFFRLKNQQRDLGPILWLVSQSLFPCLVGFLGQKKKERKESLIHTAGCVYLAEERHEVSTLGGVRESHLCIPITKPHHPSGGGDGRRLRPNLGGIQTGNSNLRKGTI